MTKCDKKSGKQQNGAHPKRLAASRPIKRLNECLLQRLQNTSINLHDAVLFTFKKHALCAEVVTK